MSETQIKDLYLAQQTAPEQAIELDAKFGSIRMFTPVGRFAYANVERPHSVQQPDGSRGPEQFTITILMNPNTCGDLYRAICMVAENRFPPEQKPDPQQGGALRPYSASELLMLPRELGGLHYPLRTGDSSYQREPAKYEQWRGLFFMNASMHAKSSQGSAQRPIYKDEKGFDIDPSKFYSGCYGRLLVTLFPFPKLGAQGRGARGVGIGLNVVQFASHGEPMSTFNAGKDADARLAKVSGIAPNPNAPPPPNGGAPTGYGPSHATPGSIPPGQPMSGFAAPPQQQPQQYQPQPGQAPGYAPQPQQYQPQPGQAPGYAPLPGYAPPQQPTMAPPGGGARPPGV